MDEPKAELILYRMNRARETLKEARLRADAGHWNACINRLYYTRFYYEEGRRLYTEEINAAVRGVKAAGVSRIDVVDCHGAGGSWNFNSLIPDKLDPDCKWVTHHAWSRYTELLEQRGDCSIVCGNACTCCGTRERDVSYYLDDHLLEASKIPRASTR